MLLEKSSKHMYTMACTQATWSMPLSLLPCRIVMLPSLSPEQKVTGKERLCSVWILPSFTSLSSTSCPFYCHFTIPSPAVSLWEDLGKHVLRSMLVESHFYLLVLLEIIFSCVRAIGLFWDHLSEHFAYTKPQVRMYTLSKNRRKLTFCINKYRELLEQKYYLQ